MIHERPLDQGAAFKEGRAKVELALARGRRLYDKRHAIATRDAERDAAREARVRPARASGGGPARNTTEGISRARCDPAAARRRAPGSCLTPPS